MYEIVESLLTLAVRGSSVAPLFLPDISHVSWWGKAVEEIIARFR